MEMVMVASNAVGVYCAQELTHKDIFKNLC